MKRPTPANAPPPTSLCNEPRQVILYVAQSGWRLCIITYHARPASESVVPDSPSQSTRHKQNSLSPAHRTMGKMLELVPDVLQLAFEQLAGDSEALLNVSLTCRAWRSLALPCVYQVVDISSHNNGRRPDLESDMFPIVSADYDARWRQVNLVPRQRAFLRTMTDKPHLATYVKSFTWTLIWKDIWDIGEEDDLTDLDRQTWDVFSRMVNVTHLDLASLHLIDDEGYVRQNPARLFPKVRDLRLLGYMHRGLVRAIITSLDTCKLRSLKLDYLADEGALPDGGTISADFVIKNAHHANSTKTVGRPNPRVASSSDIFQDDLIMRQESGEAYIFPGPMWLPLYLLSAHDLDSLTHLQIKLEPFSMTTDLRNYHTMFRQAANLVIKVRHTLKSLFVAFGEKSSLYQGKRPYECGTGYMRRRTCYRPWCIKMAKLFLEQQLSALNENEFPRLDKIHFEGFHLLEDANDREAADAELEGVFQSIRDCRFTNATFTDLLSLDERLNFNGCSVQTDEGRFSELLARS